VSENGSREGRSRDSRAAVLRDEAAPCRTVVPLKVCHFRRRQNRHQILPVPARAPAVMDQRARRAAPTCTAWSVLRDKGKYRRVGARRGLALDLDHAAAMVAEADQGKVRVHARRRRPGAGSEYSHVGSTNQRHRISRWLSNRPANPYPTLHPKDPLTSRTVDPTSRARLNPCATTRLNLANRNLE
jgi:hypothetical protein